MGGEEASCSKPELSSQAWIAQGAEVQEKIGTNT